MTTGLEVEIRGLSADSRKIEPGFLFAALPGSKLDGRRFIAEAAKKGAVAVLAPEDTEVPAGITLVADENPRRRLALMAARFYGRQPRTIAAVTGTSGKTSTAEFTRQIWALLDRRAASLGTLGVIAPQGNEYLSLTTLDPIELHRRLAALADAGIDHLAMEASSHGLDQFRLDGVQITVAAFTNLSRDHLDYHGSMAAYLASKRRLFAEVMEPGRSAVLNADAPEFDDLAAACLRRNHRVTTFGRRRGDLRLIEQHPEGDGQRLLLEVFGQRQSLRFPVPGAFQADNLLAALGLVVACGEPLALALGAVPRLTGVHGRIERVARHPNGAPIYVDYSHKPGALEAVLTALRPHAQGRLVVVFGCGGDRDRGKRPLMGRVVSELADRAIVTSDNPRSEDPAGIAAEVAAGAVGPVEVELDRRAAIELALAGAAPGDVVVIAGRGAEAEQELGTGKVPFDDREVARELLRQVIEEAR